MGWKSQINQLNQALIEAWTPRPKVSLADWAEANIYLPATVAAEPGPLRFARTPYLKAIADEIDNEHNTAVVWVAASQVSKTTLLASAALRDVVEGSAPTMLVLSTIGLAEGFSKERFSPMIAASSQLSLYFGNPKARDGRNTLDYKEAINGGFIKLIGANSAAELRSRPIKKLYLDEVSSYPPNKEGDVVNLLKQRQVTFFDATTVLASTPVFKGDRIESEYESTDQRKLFVPCPHCGHFQHLVWAQVRWEPGKPATAAYFCNQCDRPWAEYQRQKAIKDGEWRPTAAPKPGFERCPGFHLNALYSPWLTLETLTAEWLDAQGDRLKLQTFINTKLAEGYQVSEYNDLDPDGFAKRAEAYDLGTVPIGGLVLTAGVDVQADRLVFSVYAWGVGEECWLIDHYQIYGNPLLLPEAEGSPWPGLDIALAADYPHESGSQLKITLSNIDSGYATQDVYRYVLSRQKRFRVRAVDGRSTLKVLVDKAAYPQVDRKGKAKKNGGVQLWPVGVNVAKKILYSRLALTDPGPRYIHFPQKLAPNYYQELTGEQISIKYSRGFPQEVWELKPGRENHALDCFVYALAAAYHLRLDSPQYPWDTVRDTLAHRGEADAQASPTPSPPSSSKPQINKITGKPRGAWIGNQIGKNRRGRGAARRG